MTTSEQIENKRVTTPCTCVYKNGKRFGMCLACLTSDLHITAQERQRVIDEVIGTLEEALPLIKKVLLAQLEKEKDGSQSK